MSEMINETLRTMPLLALRGLSVFPGMLLTFDVERSASVAALNMAVRTDQLIFLAAQKDPLADAQVQSVFRSARAVSLCPPCRPFCPGGRGLCPACLKEPQPCGIRCARSRIPGCPCPAMQLCIALSVQPAEQQRAAAVHAASPATMHTPSLTEIS